MWPSEMLQNEIIGLFFFSLLSLLSLCYTLSCRLLDFLNVMTYDFHGAWDSFTGHNSPLYRSSFDDNDNIYYNVDFAMKYWKDQGAPAEKLMVGFATYGRTFRTASAAHGVGAPASGPASAGPYTREAGFWSYYEICTFLQGSSLNWIDEQSVPYAVKGNEWVGFDNRQSYAIKAQYLKDNHYGGAFIWALDLDDFLGQFCGQGNYPLISHLRSLLGTDFPITPPTTRPPTSSTEGAVPPTDVGTGAPTKSTTTPVSESDFCAGKADGLYANDKNENAFHQCFNGQSYLHSCPPNLAFNDKCKCCDWA